MTSGTVFSVRQMKRPSKVLREAKEYADQTMKMFHKFQKDHVDLAAVEKERQDLRKRMNKAEKGMPRKLQSRSQRRN